jgi:hypothetical protein
LSALPLFALFWPSPPALLALASLHTVSLVGEFLPEEFLAPGTTAPWARPWVAFLTFNLTSPSAPDIRIAFRFVGVPFAASPC